MLVLRELLQCPQSVKLVRIAWINNISGQIYAAILVKRVGQNRGPLRQWQRDVGAFQQCKRTVGRAIGRHNCQRRPADGDASNSRRDVTNLKKVDLRVRIGPGRKGGEG